MHIMQASHPLPGVGSLRAGASERLDAGVVSAMQKKRTLGVIRRYVIVARKAGCM